MAIPVACAVAALVTSACGNGGQEPSATQAATVASALTTETPAPLVSNPTETPEFAYDGDLWPGVWARVEGARDCLNFRFRDSNDDSSPINYCRPDGFQVYIADGPRLNEGRWWWSVAGHGWAADEFLAFDREGDLAATVVPELEGQGKIAYMYYLDLWLMDADGSNRERIVDFEPEGGAVYSGGLGSPIWSPDGSQILLTVSVQQEDGVWNQSLRVVDLTGRTLYEIPNAVGGSWSPDGERLAILQDFTEKGDGVLEATPAVVDLESGDRTIIGPPGTHLQGPMWLANGHELVYRGEDGNQIVQADGSGSRPAAPNIGGGPQWSPDGDRVAQMHYSSFCQGYVVSRAGVEQPELCVPHPPTDPNRGGRGGWSEDGATDWSPDGSLFAYHTEWAVSNLSGVYVVDSLTGDQTLLPGWKPAYTSFSPDSGAVVFATSWNGSFIWVGDVETGQVTLLAEGDQPAWQPATAGR